MWVAVAPSTHAKLRLKADIGQKQPTLVAGLTSRIAWDTQGGGKVGAAIVVPQCASPLTVTSTIPTNGLGHGDNRR